MKIQHCSLTSTRSGVRFIRSIAIFAASVVFLGLVQSHAADILSWSGGAAPDGNWSRIENWGSAGVPANGDTLIFTFPQPNQTTTNDIPGLVLNQIKFLGGGGGYSIRGNAFTVTNNIFATNTAGVNIISNDIAFGPTTPIVTMGGGATLTLAGSLSGTTGFTKSGGGLLIFSGPGANTYTGATTVNGGTLQLAKTVADGAIPGGSLFIFNSTVQELAGNQLGPMPITVEFALLDLNGNSDTVGDSLTLLGGVVQTGAGSLNLAANPTITVSNSACSIYGNINIGTGICTIHAPQNLFIYANVSGASSISKLDGGDLYMTGANSFTGDLVMAQGGLWVGSPFALGTTNGVTIISNNASLLWYGGGFGITNETVILDGTGEGGGSYGKIDNENPNSTNTWAGPVILNTPASTIAPYAFGSQIRIAGPISGSGGVRMYANSATGSSLVFEGATPNTYAGLTILDAAVLLLNKTPFDGAIPHDLDIGGGVVRNLRESQINNLATVTVGAAGTLDLSMTLATNTILASPVHNFNSSGNFTLGYSFTPNANLKVTHVRHYFGTKVEIWTDSGTLLASQNVTSTPGTWVETALTTPLLLNAGVHYRVAAYTTNSYYWRTDLATNFPYGTIDVSYEANGDAFPTSNDGVRWWFVDLRYAPIGGDGVGSVNGSGSLNLGSYYVNSFATGAHTYDGVISGAGGTFYVSGPLDYTLNGDNTYSGATFLSDGTASTVKINGFQPLSPVYVGSLNTLGGSGTVGNITNNGTISPGNGPGMLSCSNVVFNPAHTFAVELTGPTAGADYDQLNVRGTCFVTNAALGINLAFTKPVAVGQQFVIINNDGADPIKGHFAGYNEGDSWQQNGYTAVISYVGGDGNDVTLTLTTIPGDTAGSVVTSGNGDGVIAPNECNYFSVAITNKTGTPMTGVTATLASQTPGVIVIESPLPYPNIAGNGKGTNTVPFQISTTPNFVCGSSINLTLSVTSASHGAFIVPLTLPTGTPSASPVRFDNNTTIGLSDISTNESTNVVSTWTGGPLAKVAVSLWLSAPLDSDLSLTLIAPNGASVDLSSGNGSGPNFGTGSADGNRTTFDDAASTSITAGSPPFVGTFKAEAPLSALIGTTPVIGNWRLRVADPFFFGAGDTLRNWSLFLYGTDCGTGSGLCELCPNVTFTTAFGPNTPLQTNYLAASLSNSVCGIVQPCPGAVSGTYRADDFAFRNGPSDACITVTVTNISVTGNMSVGAYSEGYIPLNPDRCANYLANPSNYVYYGTPVSSQSFSFNVASNALFWVHCLGGTAGNYKVTVAGGDCRPALDVTDIGGGKAKLDWTTAAAGYQLESTNILGSGSSVWPAITNTPAVVNSRFQVTNTVPAANQFYHLRKPVP